MSGAKRQGDMTDTGSPDSRSPGAGEGGPEADAPVEVVGIVGVGIMGSAMAANLLDAGFGVVVHDVEPVRVAGVVDRGGQAAEAAGDVARRSDVVITSLSDADAIDDVVGAADGLVAGTSPGLVVVETSTLPIAAKQAARERLAAVGATLLDCPLSGTGGQAGTRDLAVYASGDPDALRRCRPVLDAVARTTHDVGPFGNGSRMKYVANLLVLVHNLATAEALVFAERMGLDLDAVQSVVASGAGTSRIFELRGPTMAAGNYDDVTASIRMFMKDLDIISDVAVEVGAPTHLLAAAARYYAAAIDQGRANQDAAALHAVLRELTP